jgi:ribosomal protein L21E
MSHRKKTLSQAAVLALLAAALGAPAQAFQAAGNPVPTQATVHETLTITARGPLGGEISGRVEDAVKNLAQVKAGDMVSVSYRSSMALSASKPGQPNPLFTGGDTSTAEPGQRPALSVSEQSKHTVTVVSVDAEKRTVVLQGQDGTLFPVEVERPEFARKLQTLRPGDKIDIVITEAVIARIAPAASGEKAKMAYTASTLIVERGEVLYRSGNVVVLRNEQGRSVRVTVDPKFKFTVDGKEITVADLKPGTRLVRTALRTEKVESQ